MATNTYKATARIPTRPLSYENKHMAYKKELIVDYVNGMVYVIDENGDEHDVSKQVYTQIIENGDISKDLSIIIQQFNKETGKWEDTNVTIQDSLAQNIKDISEINSNITQINKIINVLMGRTEDLDPYERDPVTGEIKTDPVTGKPIIKPDGYVRDPDTGEILKDPETGEPILTNDPYQRDPHTGAILRDPDTGDPILKNDPYERDPVTNAIKRDPDTGAPILKEVKINSSNIIEDATHQFVTAKEKASLQEKISVKEVYVDFAVADITGSAAPYTCVKTVTGVDPSYPRPIIDIAYRDSIYANNNKEEDAFYNLYRCTITTKDQATFYFKDKPKDPFRIVIQIKIPGINS